MLFEAVGKRDSFGVEDVDGNKSTLTAVEGLPTEVS
jgi:hypothetical protein